MQSNWTFVHECGSQLGKSAALFCVGAGENTGADETFMGSSDRNNRLRLVCPHISYFTFPCMKELPSSSLWRVSLRHMQALRKGLHRSEWHQPSCQQKRMG